jgi:two-component system, NarL family, invasion response regulator UvrY
MANESGRCQPQSMPEALGSVSVLAVDDHPRFLEAARAVVEAAPGFAWVGGFSSGEDALEEAGRHRPDMVLVDVHMPGMDGFELARELRRAHPETLVALISAQHPDELPRAGDVDVQAVLAKENLRPSWLRQIWQAHCGAPPLEK